MSEVKEARKLVNADAEAGMLASILANPICLRTLRHTVKPAHLAAGWHRQVYEAMIELDDQRKEVDFITLQHRLEERGELHLVGPQNLTGLMTMEFSAINASHYMNIILDLAERRALIAAAEKVAQAAYSDKSMADVRNDSRLAIEGAVMHRGDDGWVAMATAVEQALADMDDETASPPISTGFRRLDEAMDGGMRRGESWAICGRPGMGKSSLGFQLAVNQAKLGYRVGFFGLEMPAKNLAKRALAAMTDISGSKIRSRKLNDSDLDMIAEAAGELYGLPIYFNKWSRWPDLRSAILSRKVSHGLDVVYVDYLQLVENDSGNGRFGNRNLEIAQISRGLKNIAMEHDVAVVPLSQMSRDNEKEKDKRPQMHHLRDSGAIEQDQDGIIGLYREDYYDKNTPDRGIAEAIFLKQREGGTPVVKLGFSEMHTKFFDI